ncbi:MAG TPA: thiamine pyrophosphate-binding protein [Lacunisphaera sp.]|nr:thiamine pyrophosphate-binding protein [Lacunisphaera sp.]
MSDKQLSKYSGVLADWLVEAGYTHCFMVAGGGCMHLIDGFRTRFTCIPVVHEVAAGIAAEHFNECRSAGRAFALVTTGPGLTNIVTAVAGCYTERRELLVIAGQVKSTDLLAGGLRQRGIQEVDGTSVTRAITVRNTCLRAPIGRRAFRELVFAARGPHPGPVVIEVCLDVQGALVDRPALEAEPDAVVPAAQAAAEAARVADAAGRLADELSRAERPLLLLGGLVSRQLAWESLPALEQLGIPVMTVTSAIDRVPSDSPVHAGRPGSWGGQRAANLLMAQADVVAVIGAQLDLQQTGFNWQGYAPGARITQVYPCAEELAKGHPPLAVGVNAAPDDVFRRLLPRVRWRDTQGWREYVRKVRELVPVLEPANTVRPGQVSSFVVLRSIARAARPDDILAISSSGGTFTGGLQMMEVARGQYATTSPAYASMGWALSTAIGAALARPGQRVIHVEGDGGFAQNLQELAVVRRQNLPLKMFVFDNHGYASIRATQKKFFGGAYVGCDEETGLGSPDWPALFRAYGIPARHLEPDEATPERLAALMDKPGAEAWIVHVDPDQSNFPAVATRLRPDGKMESSPLYDMLPPLDPVVWSQVSRYLPKTR